jgi:hypothetical protein
VLADDMFKHLVTEGHSFAEKLTPAQQQELLSHMTWTAFVQVIPQIAKVIRGDNAAKGFGFIPEELLHSSDETVQWAQDRLDATAIGLIMGEVAEMLEARRRPGWETDPSEHIAKFTGLVEEGADVIIRVLDLFERLGLSAKLAEAIPAKLVFNRSRPHKHGRTF